MRSNCFVFAFLLWRRRKKYWSDPIRRDRAPRYYINIRKADDCNYPHFLYEERSHKVSFKPFDVATGPLPSIWFKGRVCWGDRKIQKT